MKFGILGTRLVYIATKCVAGQYSIIIFIDEHRILFFLKKKQY